MGGHDSRSILAAHMAMPHEGHLIAAYHDFSYIKKHHNSHIDFGPSYPEINKSAFMSHDWKEFVVMCKKRYHRIPPHH